MVTCVAIVDRRQSEDGLVIQRQITTTADLDEGAWVEAFGAEVRLRVGREGRLDGSPYGAELFVTPEEAEHLARLLIAAATAARGRAG
jgi:hypothetical protein